MANERHIMDLKTPSRPLPEILLPSASGGGPVSLTTSPRWSLVIMFLHSLDCSACLHFLQQLKESHSDLISWDAEVAIVLNQFHDHATIPETASSIRVLVDAENAFESAARVVPPAVLMVDQWRDIRQSWEATEAHRFPNFSEIVSWARYLATQCPECEGESL